MHQRIVLTASALVLLVVALASFFSMRITMQEEQGIHIARRTVAKYRMELRLGSAAARKQS